MYRSIFINGIVLSCHLSKNDTSYYENCQNIGLFKMKPLIEKPCIWVEVLLFSPHSRQSGLSASSTLCLWYARLPCPINTFGRVFTSFLLSMCISATRLGFWCSPMRVLACLHAVALYHSFWCSSAHYLPMLLVTNLFEIPITGSRPVGFCFVASFASLSAISLPLIPLCPGIMCNLVVFS